MVKLKSLADQYDLVHICDNPVYSSKIVKLIEKLHWKGIFTIHDPEGHLPGTIQDLLKRKIKLHYQNKLVRELQNNKILRLHLHYEYMPITKKTGNVTILPHPLYHDSVGVDDNPPTLPLVISFLGRIEYYKGIDIFMEILKELDDMIPKYSVKAIIGGFGRIPDHKPYENIIYVEENRYLEEDKFEELLNESHIVLLPYRDTSQSGVLMKALTNSIPVIVSDIPSLNVFVEHGKTGWSFANDDLKSWIDAIIYFIDNINDLDEISRNIDQFKKSFSPLNISKQLYGSVIEHN
jgi:glycosyltransferase involved in cell wall biosynthesis